MSNIPPPHRRARKDGAYTADEKNVIVRYKEEYRKLTTRDLRVKFLREYILCDMFNYWEGVGKRPKDDTERKQWMKV